ncbi:hypothetical protein LP416_29390 [Polaromonas sp. P2-4]|nr:hypothetical protein LP416_29390 [Polaromonas sp. P2-4]
MRELQGDIVHRAGKHANCQKEIACTRSFGHPVTDLTDLSAAVTEFASRGRREAVKTRQSRQ